jgi:hypothetical protein
MRRRLAFPTIGAIVSTKFTHGEFLDVPGGLGDRLPAPAARERRDRERVLS